MQPFMTSVKTPATQKNQFDLSHDLKCSLNAGYLYPTLAVEVVPGERFNISVEGLTKMMPLQAPMMSRADVCHHLWFVPLRLLWAGFEEFITEFEKGAVLPATPTLVVNEGTWDKVLDFLGCPQPPIGKSETINAFALAAYQFIYNEKYRDQNLIDPVEYQLINGDNSANSDLINIRRRAWEADYFTSCLPTAQLGLPITVPIGGFEDVAVQRKNVDGVIAEITTDQPTEDFLVGSSTSANAAIPADRLFAKTSDIVAGSVTLEDLRLSKVLQEWLEMSMRAGRRMIESIPARFGIKPQDMRLQQPEFIGGTKTPFTISEVLQTGETTADSPQGNMAGHGASFISGDNDHYQAMEWGYIMCLTSIIPRTTYSQGIPAHLLKMNDPFQFLEPKFAELGEQAIKKRQLLAYDDDGDDDFGYLPRYAEYRTLPNRVCGNFRPGKSLEMWVWQRKFATMPVLDQEFIQCDPNYDPFVVTASEEDHFYMHLGFNIRAVRPLGIYGTPSF